MTVSPQLLAILVCPKCKGELEHRASESNSESSESSESLVCHACKLRYAVRDGIPIMLIDEASPL